MRMYIVKNNKASYTFDKFKPASDLLKTYYRSMMYNATMKKVEFKQDKTEITDISKELLSEFLGEFV